MFRSASFWWGTGAGGLSLLVAAIGLMQIFDVSLATRAERSLYIQVIPDTQVPPTWRDAILSVLAADKASEQNHRLRLVITQRLYVAFEMLNVAESGTWSLATWAQLEWVRKTLDGDAPFHSHTLLSLFPEFENYSFTRLLNDFVATSRADRLAEAQDLQRDGGEILVMLSGVSAETKEADTILNSVAAKIVTLKGLRPITEAFPSYTKIEVKGPR